MQGEKRYIKLTKEEQTNLEKGRKTGKKASFRQRCHYILLSHQGMKVHEIAEIYQVSRQSITRWFDRFEEANIDGLHTAKGQGRDPIVRIDNEAEIALIEKLVEASPQNLNPVLAKIEEELGKTMSKRTLKRLLVKKTGCGSVSERKQL